MAKPEPKRIPYQEWTRRYRGLKSEWRPRTNGIIGEVEEPDEEEQEQGRRQCSEDCGCASRSNPDAGCDCECHE